MKKIYLLALGLLVAIGAQSNEEFNGYDFETGIEPWTTIDADGDGYTWQWIDIKFTTHNESAGCVSSASYVNNVGALTPDNWLVSPQVELGGTMTFWATAQDPNYPAEHFQVYVSTAGNTEPADFTEVTPEYVIYTGLDYQLYEVDLSAYSGQQGYVAIRHFNVTDQYWMNVDDIEFHPASEGIEMINADDSSLDSKKLLIDGHLYIISNGKIYTIQGQKVK